MPADFKSRVYTEFARIGQALASERRLELLDLLAQGPRHVESLAAETGMSVANASQHLQMLRRLHLIESEREGNRVVYRLADEHVLRLWLAFQEAGAARLPEVDRLASDEAVAGAAGEEVARAALEKLIADGAGYLIDVRPNEEFAHGHLPGAASIPIEELPNRLGELPRKRAIVAYCRGKYCQQADQAVALLRKHGFEAHRLEGGWPEWLAEGRKVSSGA